MPLKPVLAACAALPCLAMSLHADELTRLATVPLEAEVTGLFTHQGDLFLNVQHPSAKLPGPFAKATIGVIANADFAASESPLPQTDQQKATVTTSLGAYQILLQAGDLGRIGVIEGADGHMFVSRKPDFNGYVPTSETTGYLFTSWEDRPGGMSRVHLSRAVNGTWSVAPESAMMIDFTTVRGTWTNCFGTISPWGTPLASEELYFDDTDQWNNPLHRRINGPLAMQAYLGRYPNPYDYGYIIEIADPIDTPAPVKMFAMGRYSHENAVVMPDRKTVYLSDDGTDAVFFKFVADVAGDLGAGTLFAAKITQHGAPGANPAKTALGVDWIELAHGTNAQIETWVRSYDGITLTQYRSGASSYISDAQIAAWADGKAPDDRVAFLESRKAARAKGATAEFRKMEGVNIHHDALQDGRVPYMYMAMSQISAGMTDNRGDIQLAENPCGVVYRMALDDNFDVHLMQPVVAGGPYDTAAAPNTCAPDAIANPDNLLLLPDGAVVIGEDSGNHENNAVWLYRPQK